jgi:hypothetical protein
MARPITLHESASCNLTPRAATILNLLNLYKYRNPSSTFAEMANWFNAKYAKDLIGYSLSAMTLSRYYYGYHSVNNNKFGGKGRGCFNQVREGASTPWSPENLIADANDRLTAYINGKQFCA